MKINKIKLLKYWNKNKILSYHNKPVTNSFKINNLNNISLKFLNNCWVKKWDSIESLKNSNDFSSIITISIGGNFIIQPLNNDNSHDLIILNHLNNLTQIVYLELYISLINFVSILNNVNSNNT